MEQVQQLQESHREKKDGAVRQMEALHQQLENFLQQILIFTKQYSCQKRFRWTWELSRADYSAPLEFGTKNMGARPFMQPSLEQNRPKIRARARREFK